MSRADSPAAPANRPLTREEVNSVFYLSQVKDMGTYEIAKELNVKPKAVKKLLERHGKRE